MQQLMAAPNSPRARTMYLIGWMLGGRIGDVSLASEFPVSQLYAPLGNVPMQLNLMQASGEDLDQAEKRLMQMINTDRTHDWSWLRGMRSFVDHQNRARVEGTVQAVYQPAPGRGCPQEGPCLHPIPMHWVRNQLTSSELVNMVRKNPSLLNRFASGVRAADEVWFYDAPAEAWRSLGGERGLLLVRAGRVIDQVILLMN